MRATTVLMMRGQMWRLYASEVLTGSGDGIVWVAVVVALADEPRFGLLLGLGVVARLGPRAVLSIPAGALIDRGDLRRLLVLSSAARAVLMGALSFAVAGSAGPATILGLLLFSNIAGVAMRPGLAAAVPPVAGERHLAIANARLSTLKQVFAFVGPLMGVGLVAWSAELATAITGVTYLAAAVVLAGVSGLPRRSPTFVDSLRVEPVGQRRLDPGWRVRSVEGLTKLVALIGAMYFVRGSEMVLLVLVVRDLLDEDPSVIGWLSGAVGIGAVVAIPLASRRADGGLRSTVWLSIALTAAPTAALVFISQTWVACLVLVFVGIGMVVFEVASVVAVQRVIDLSHLGRAFGAVNMSANVGRLTGALAAPALVAVLGLRGSLLVVSGVLVVVGLVVSGALDVLGTRAEWCRQSLEPMVHVLHELALFEGAPPAALERVARQLSEEQVPPGTVVIAEGDEADDLYVIRSGHFEVTVDGNAVNEMDAGDWFGEIGLIDRVPRTATVTAATGAVVWRIPGRVFLDVLEETGAAPTALLGGIADRLAAGAHRADDPVDRSDEPG